MKILPLVTEPWSSKIARRHDPQPAASHHEYLPCLRWEFGFSCVFCLCHEADLSSYGRRTEIEHLIPVSHDNSQKNIYSNCCLICPFCNRSRSAAPIDNPLGEGRLLNPCEVAWQDVFILEGNELQPREESSDAAYTRDTYDFNEPRKMRMRQLRREAIEAFSEFQGRFRELQVRLLAKAKKNSDPELVDVAQEMQNLRGPIAKELARFQAIPWNADQFCRCGDTENHSLPDVLDQQTLDINLINS
jgi:hypothetical protein